MFCKNCGLEISSDAKFCPGCGIAVEDTEVKNDVAISEKAEENAVSHVVTENQQSDDESSVENKPDEAEKDTVNTQPAESPSELEQNDNEAVESANESKQSETAKSGFSATDNIKEVLLPQKGKKGKVKFKDLPKKQKIIRIAIGAGLLLIALIWIVSDGVSGAKKAGNSDSKNDQTQSSEMVELNKEIKTIAYNNDTGALFDLTLDEFSDLFSKTALQITEEVSPETKLNKKWNIKDYWGNKAEPQTGYEETSGEEFTIYTAFFEGTHIAVTTMNEKINSVRVGFDYDNNDLATVYGAVVYSVFSGLDWREAEEKIFNPVKNGIMDNTMIYKDGALFAITTTDYCYLVTASSDKYVSSLKNSGKCNVVYYSDSDVINTDVIAENEDGSEFPDTIDFFGLIEDYIEYEGANGFGKMYINNLTKDTVFNEKEFYFVFDESHRASDGYGYDDWNVYTFKVIYDNSKIGEIKLETGDEDHNATGLTEGDTVCLHLKISEGAKEELEKNNLYIIETEREYVVPKLSSYINMVSELSASDLSRIKNDAIEQAKHDIRGMGILNPNYVETISNEDVELYFASIKGSAENEHNAKGFVLAVIPDAKKANCYVVEYFDLYRADDNSITWTENAGHISGYETIDNIEKMQGGTGGSKVSSYSDYTFEKM